MAGLCICHSPRRNSLLDDKDELTGSPPGAPIKDSNTLNSFSGSDFCSGPASSSASSSSLKFYSRAVSAAPKDLYNQRLVIGIESRAWSLQTAPQSLIPRLYYGNLHIDCYCFCQQYENHFETTRASKPNHILFAILFLRGSVV